MKPLVILMSVPLSDSWRQWLDYNINHGADKEKLLEQSVAHGYDKNEILSILTRKVIKPRMGISEEQTGLNFVQWARPNFISPNQQPRAWKIDTDIVQMYEIPNFLSESECRLIINEINMSLSRSTVTGGGQSEYRTSRTCYLKTHNNVLSTNLDERICELFGTTDDFSEGLQGVRYDPGQYFKEHTDWFEPGTVHYDTNTIPGGQRTWTVMIYLNQPEKGGHTFFKNLDRSFVPITGTALLWNNLYPTGEGNPFTLHEALPVEKGNKYIITKWLRSQTGRNKNDT